VDLPEHLLKTNVLQRRLGENLLAEELLTPSQLEEAIEYQCIYGGKLGTSLVELGFIEEDQLAKVLSQQLKLHYIKPELLMNVPAKILNLVPKNIATKYQVVPYHEEGRRLFLAMSNTSNLTSIDELSFQLDHIIIPLAIPEVRLMLALKKHYGMFLSPRFEALAAQLNRRAQAKLKQRPKKEVTAPLKEVTAPLKEVTAPPKEKPAAPRDEEEETWPLLGEEEYEGDVYSDEAYFDTQTPPAEISYTSFCQQLAAANDRNDIARALINYLGQEFHAIGLFMIRMMTASGWLAVCDGTEAEDFHQLSIPLHEHSAIDIVVNSKSHFLGIITDTPQNRKLLSLFNAAPPQEALIIPLSVRDRLVSVLYVQDRMEILEKRFTELTNIARKAEMSFTLLILKNKLLTI